jgi:hypothetical protein
MLTRVKEEKKKAAQSATQLAAQKQGEIEKVNLRLQRLHDSFLDQLFDRETFTVEKAKMMSQKKTLEEQKARLMAGRADWLEPFQKWILTSKKAGKIAVSGSLQEKRVLALEVFGSNLILDCKKARGSCIKPWSLLVESNQTGGMEPMSGIEPPTYGLRNRCSTTELHWLKLFNLNYLIQKRHWQHFRTSNRFYHKPSEIYYGLGKGSGKQFRRSRRRHGESGGGLAPVTVKG